MIQTSGPASKAAVTQDVSKIIIRIFNVDKNFKNFIIIRSTFNKKPIGFFEFSLKSWAKKNGINNFIRKNIFSLFLTSKNVLNHLFKLLLINIFIII